VMLAVVSDLHFADGTTGPYNVNPDAWDIFFDSLERKRERSEDKLGLTLVLAGDTFDLLRSAAWLDGESRPWASRGLQDAALRILGGILAENSESLQKVKEYVRRTGARLICVTGNHDRLLGDMPELQSQVVQVLGPIEFVGLEYRDEVHDALVVHGHKWDPYNFETGGRAPIGDAIVVELFNRYPIEVAKRFPDNATLRQAICEMDNVRPLIDVPAWILWSARQCPADTVRKLKEIWNGLVAEFLEKDFVKRWMKRHNRRLSLFDEADRLNLMLKGSRLVGFKAMTGIGRRFSDLASGFAGRSRPGGARHAYLVAGHTHAPVTEALDDRHIYFNTGTWRRTSLRARDGSFVSWKVMAYTMIYGPGSRHRFATWRGELL